MSCGWCAVPYLYNSSGRQKIGGHLGYSSPDSYRAFIACLKGRGSCRFFDNAAGESRAGSKGATILRAIGHNDPASAGDGTPSEEMGRVAGAARLGGVS